MVSGVNGFKKIIVLGSGYSGSSAIVEYLVGRGDVLDALAGEEFRLVQDPGGLMELHHSIGSGFSFNAASRAIHSFKELAYNFSLSPKAFPPGLGYAQLIKNYQDIINSYLAEIVDVSYPGMPAVEAARLSAISAFGLRVLRKFHHLRNSKPALGKVYLPVPEESFLKSTNELLDRLLGSTENRGEPVVVNQGGSFWAPVSSTQYYGDRHVVVVTRNPADIFCEMISRGYAYPGRDVEIFCRWYGNMISRISVKEWESDLVTHIRFEDFVQNYASQSHRLASRLGLDGNVRSTYDANKSRKNIGKNKDILTEKERQYIASYFEGLNFA